MITNESERQIDLLLVFFLSFLTSGLSWNQRVAQQEGRVAIEIATTTDMTDEAAVANEEELVAAKEVAVEEADTISTNLMIILSMHDSERKR